MFEKKRCEKTKKIPKCVLVMCFFWFRNQKYSLALAAFLVRCKICDGHTHT